MAERFEQRMGKMEERLERSHLSAESSFKRLESGHKTLMKSINLLLNAHQLPPVDLRSPRSEPTSRTHWTAVKASVQDQDGMCTDSRPRVVGPR